MSRVKNLHDLFIVTVGVWLKVDDIYSFNNIYASAPFDCIKQHFAKMAYEHGRGFDSIKQHFDDCKSKTGVLDKPEKSRNMIAAPKGYDNKEKDLGERTP